MITGSYKPMPIDDVLVNPGMGFTTFQRTNGEESETGPWWDEGYLPGRYADTGRNTAPDHPECSLAYFRVFWKTLQPEKEEIRFDVLDDILARSASRGQTVVLRLMPHGYSPYPPFRYGIDVGMTHCDVPAWYRKEADDTGYKMTDKQLCDPENPKYLLYFGTLVREVGKRYDGDPRLEAVDISLWRAWGESSGSELDPSLRDALLACYTESFRKTRLLMMPDPVINRFRSEPLPMGWRYDSLGFTCGFNTPSDPDPRGGLMIDLYPQQILRNGLSDLWQTAPVHFEVSFVMKAWKERGYFTEFSIRQSLKWHMSAFNNKNSPIPPELRPTVDDWLKKMGYRFELRNVVYPVSMCPDDRSFPIGITVENTGVAPVYLPYRLMLRLLKRDSGKRIYLPTDADVRKWLPGDSLYEASLPLGEKLEAGTYDLQAALLRPEGPDPFGHAFSGRTKTAPITDGFAPAIHFANVGEEADGWCFCGRVKVG